MAPRCYLLFLLITIMPAAVTLSLHYIGSWLDARSKNVPPGGPVKQNGIPLTPLPLQRITVAMMTVAMGVYSSSMRKDT